MSMKDFDKNDILNAIGLETRKSTVDYLTPALGIFGAGIMLGAGLGILLAPKSGKELREDLSDKVADFNPRAEKTGSGQA